MLEKTCMFLQVILRKIFKQIRIEIQGSNLVSHICVPCILVVKLYSCDMKWYCSKIFILLDLTCLGHQILWLTHVPPNLQWKNIEKNDYENDFIIIRSDCNLKTTQWHSTPIANVIW
jgi:hypothetical protein